MKDYLLWHSLQDILYPSAFGRLTRGHDLRGIVNQSEALSLLMREVLYPKSGDLEDFDRPMPLTEGLPLMLGSPEELADRRDLEGKVTIVIEREREGRKKESAMETKRPVSSFKDRFSAIPSTLSHHLAPANWVGVDASEKIASWQHKADHESHPKEQVLTTDDASNIGREWLRRFRDIVSGPPTATPTTVNSKSSASTIFEATVTDYEQRRGVASDQQTAESEEKRETVTQRQTRKVGLPEETLREIASLVPSTRQTEAYLKDAVDRWWKATGYINASSVTNQRIVGGAKAADLSVEQGVSSVPPTVNNTFNVELRTEIPTNERELRSLADRINRILVEQARRHGITLT